VSQDEKDFPITQRYVYFDNAAVGACPRSTITLMEDYTKDRSGWLKGLEGWRECGDRWSNRVENSKKLYAMIIGAREDEISFIPNTTSGINTVFSMLPLKNGQNIVATTLAYPMDAAICVKQRERGVETRFIEAVNGEVRVEDFEKAVDDDTAVVSIDQAGWFNGYLHDTRAISEVAHEHGAYLVVDGVQSVGGLNMDVEREGIDFLATSTYKWLLGGPYSLNAGYLYINREHIDDFQPVYVGNQTMEDERLQVNVFDRFDLYDFSYRRGIDRFQIFPRSEMVYVAVENSMKILLDFGMDRVEKRIKKLGTRIIDGLIESGFTLQTPVEEKKRLYVNVKVEKNRELEKELYERDVVVSARVGGLRITPHFYNKEDEVDLFLEKLKKIVKELNRSRL